MSKDKDKRTGRFKAGNKAGVRHSGYVTITRNIPLAVRRRVQGVREQLVKDIGGTEEALTAAQSILIDKTVNLYQITLCLEAYVRREGPFRGKKLDPVLGQNYLAYVNTIRLNLLALGLDRREPAEKGILEIIAEVDAENAEREVKEAEKAALAGGLGAEAPQDRLSPEGSPDTTDNPDDAPGGGIDDKGNDDEDRR